VFLAEIAVLVFKLLVVDGDEFTKYLTFDLLDKIVDCVPIDKVSLLSVMRM
jgi:hypothetical protein